MLVVATLHGNGAGAGVVVVTPEPNVAAKHLTSRAVNNVVQSTAAAAATPRADSVKANLDTPQQDQPQPASQEP